MIRILSAILFWYAVMLGAHVSATEIAPYEVLEQDGNFELRHYHSLVLAKTPIQETGRTRSSFSKLFNYISGDNKTDTKIKMTAPVFMDRAPALGDETATDGTSSNREDHGSTQYMSFVMPSTFTYPETPLPNDPGVKIEHVKDYTVAVVRFSGRLKKSNIEKHKAQLQKWIKANQLETTGSLQTAGYNSPFTLPAFRRNEVLIGVKRP